MAARIVEHLILGVLKKGALVKFTFDGKELEGRDWDKAEFVEDTADGGLAAEGI